MTAASDSPRLSDQDGHDFKVESVDAIEYVEKDVVPRVKGLSEDDRQWLSSIDAKEGDRIYHKVDRRLVPMLALLYLIAHLDRVRIWMACGVASLDGADVEFRRTSGMRRSKAWRPV
jgi:hypothetical protein